MHGKMSIIQHFGGGLVRNTLRRVALAASCASPQPSRLPKLREDMADLLGSALGMPVTINETKRMASLWAGYGHVTSMSLSLPTGPITSSAVPSHIKRLISNCKERQLDLIIKQVDPPSGSGIGHERKMKSYQVEAEFYRCHAPVLLRQPPLPLGQEQQVPQPEAGVCPAAAVGPLRHSPQAGADEPPWLPVPLLVDCDPSGAFTFLLSDLRPDFPICVADVLLTRKQLEAALTWVARLHAHFWEVPAAQVAGLWLPQGSYWHLDTRMEELGRMDAEWLDLREAAPKLDQLLKGLQPDDSFSERHMTVCHGDFKNQNMMFSADGSRCAAYDFQYVGRSYGARDVAYLLARSADSQVWLDPEAEENLLRHYHAQLHLFLGQRDVNREPDVTGGAAGEMPAVCLSGSEDEQGLRSGSGSARPSGSAYSFEVLQLHYDWALLDFVRFRTGWRTRSASDWASRKARVLLAKLRAGLGIQQ